MDTDMRHVVRNLLLLLGAGTFIFVMVLLFVNPQVWNYSPNVEEIVGFYWGALFLAVIIGAVGLYFYLRPVSGLVRMQKAGEEISPEAVRQARERAFQAPLLFLIAPIAITFICGTVADLVGTLFLKDYSFLRHYPDSILGTVAAAAVGLMAMAVSRRILRPVLIFCSNVDPKGMGGARFSMRRRQLVITLLMAFIPIAFIGILGYNLTLQSSRNAISEKYALLARTIAMDIAPRLDDASLISYIQVYDLEAPGYAFLLDDQMRRLTETPAQYQNPALVGRQEIPWETVLFPIQRGDKVWHLGFVYQVDPIDDPVGKQTVGILLIFCIGMAFFSFWVAFYTASDVTRDLRYVTARLTALAHGEEMPLERVPVVALDEVGDLALAFNEIQERVREQQRQMEREQKELLTLQQISQKISSILESDQLLREIVLQVEAAFGYRSTGIFLLEESGQSLYPGALSDSTPEEVTARHIPVGAGSVIGRVAATSKPEIISDVRTCTEYICDDPEVRSELAVPIIFNGKVLGVFNVESPTLNAFGERDLQILTTLSNQAGVALHNARLYREMESRRQSAAILAQVARMVSSTLNLQEVMNLALAQLKRLVQYDSASILLMEGDDLVFEAGMGFQSVEALLGQRISAEEANLGYQVMLSQQTRVVRDVQDVPEWGHHRDDLEGAHTIRSWIGAPLVVRGHSIGLLTLDGYQPDFYQSEDGDRVTAFAFQISAAIQNARLYQKVLSNAEDLSLLYEVSQQITGLLHVESLLEGIVERIQAAFGFEVVSIHLIDPATGMLQVMAERGIKDEALMRQQCLTDDCGIVPLVAGTGQLRLVRNVVQEPRYIESAPGIGSELAIPVIGNGVVMGVLNLESSQVDAFGTEQVRLLTALAHQLAAALENAHLFERVRTQAARLELLQQVSRQISSILSIDQLLNEVMSAVTMAFGYRYITIMLLDESTDELYVGAMLGYAPEIAQLRLPLSGGGISTVAASTRTPVYVPDVTQDARYISGESTIRSEIAIPLLTGRRVIGVFNLESEELDAFQADDVALMTALAHQVTVALENARLFESARTQALELARMAGNLADEKSKLDAILRNIADGLIVTDPQGYVLLVNPAFEQLFGLAAHKVVGGKLTQVVTERQLQRLITGVLTEEVRGGATMEIYLAGGRTLKASALAIQEERPLGVVTVLRDVTHEKEVDRMKTEFISTVSHELRTPLTSVLGFAKLISKTFEREIVSAVPADQRRAQQAVRRVRENLDIIVIEGERLTRLINDVLDISRMEAGKVEWHDESLDLRDLIGRVVDTMQPGVLEKRLELYVEAPGPFPTLTADPLRVQQVLVNLLSNAVKFTEQGMIQLTAQALEPGTMVHDWMTPAVGGVRFSIQDSGMGIAAESLPKLFQRFQQIGDTLRDKPKGTGLGLAICREIITHYGGVIWAESELGVGSTFHFTLPLVRTPLEQQPMPVNPVAAGSGGLPALPMMIGAQRLLVVDDEDHIRSLLAQELAQAGYQILEARNGAEALALARREHPALVVLDVMMPDISGFDVTRILKADPATAEIPILILSIIEDRQRGLSLGANAYLTKPVETEQLLETIAGLLKDGESRQ